jgi:hypothetical protein
MRPLFLCLLPCYLLSAAPSTPGLDARPPERPAPVIVDRGQRLSDAEEMSRLAHERPLEFLRECLLRYKRNVRGYTLTMSKQERIGGALEKQAELMEVASREEPFSVFLKWDKGAKRAECVLYVEGENDDKILARPAPLWAIAARAAGRAGRDGLVFEDVNSDDARQAGRFTIREFGMYHGLARLLADWEAADKKGALHVEHLGEQEPEEAGGRRCHVLRRTRFLKPERDGVTEQTVYIDAETWLQVGSVANGAAGLIGAYFYRDVKVNPEFPPDQFTRAALKK